MEIYKIPIEFAFVVFPFIAFILTIPFLIHQYRKYGAIPLLKSACFYSMILYLICAYFLVILPLPSIESISKVTSPRTQLELFQFVKDIMVTVNFNIKGLSDILIILKSSTIYTILFNIVLTLPFGIYLRYFFKKKWYQSLLYTFLLSLFFEVTQLSGLYGIYPRPYRLFDVDDLLINSIGGLLGHAITPLLTFFLPSRDELEEISYKKGTKVTLLRRIMALSIDLIFLLIFSLVTKILVYGTWFSDYYILTTLSIYYIVIPIFTSGQTLGKRILRLKITTNIERKKINWYQILLRNFLLVYVFVYPFTWMIILKKYTPSDIMNRLYLVMSVVQIINIVYFIVNIPKKEHLFLYEILSKTKNASTIERAIQIPQKTVVDEKKEKQGDKKYNENEVKEDKHLNQNKNIKNKKSENCKKKKKHVIIK